MASPSRLKSVSVIKLLQARGVGNKEDNCVGLGRRAIVVVGGYQVGCSVGEDGCLLNVGFGQPFSEGTVAPRWYGHCDEGGKRIRQRDGGDGPPYRLFECSAVEGGAGVERPARPRDGVAVVGCSKGLVGRILGVVSLKRGAERERGGE